MKYFLKVITTPSCWLRLSPYNAEYDKLILKLLKSEEIVVGTFTTKLGNLNLWTRNFPYAYGSPRDNGDDMLPSRSTVFKLHEAVTKQRLLDMTKGTK